MPPSDRWSQFRRQMPVVEKYAYFDHAAVSPLPSPTQDAIAGWLNEAVHEGVPAWSGWTEQLERTRRLAAAGLGADPAEIALTANTTSGVNFVADGVPWEEGDNVVTLANEFPTNLYPWLNLARRGVETRAVDVPTGGSPADGLLEACDARTRLITVSWISYATGWRIDVDELVERAHQRGVRVFLDSIQGMGVFPLNVSRTPVDFAAADGHKWMLGPEGAGMLYVRREHLDWLRPVGVGWNSVRRAFDYSRPEFNLRPDARRYEGGSMNMAGFHGFGASLQLLTDLGWGPDRSDVGDRVLVVTDQACERLRSIGATIVSSRDGERRSGIVSFEKPGADPHKLRRRCLEAGVILSCREGRLRIAPHAYNNDEDLDRLVEALQS